MERRLTTILAADVVGYSRLMGADDAGTLAALKYHREGLFDPKAAQYRGRTVKLMGDGALMEFASVVDTVSFAVDVQAAMAARNEGVAEDQRIVFRIGINIGDIIVEGDDIYGDGVNVAARLEGLAEPGGICVAESVHNQVRGKLDLTFEHLGEKEVKNIAEPVSVYSVLLDDKAAALVTAVVPEAAERERRWLPAAAAVAAVIVMAVGGAFWWQPWKPDVEPASLERMAFPLPDKPSIVVLPFDNLSGDPKQDYLVDGMIETIITDLSRFRGLFVIARDSTFTYKGQPVKVRQVAEDLGVQYVLAGSMQRSADRVRITAQLIDATTGNHLWAETYDRDLSDIFAVQDEVTERIVGSLGAYQGELAEAARGRAKRKDPASFSAYDAFLVGMEHKHRFTKADNAAAERLFNKAIGLDPQFAQAYVGLAWVHIQRFWFGWSGEPEQAIAQTREAARKAIALDPSEAEAHWLLAEAYLADGEFEKGEAEYERALALNRNHADLLAGWGYASVLLGEPERGAEFIVKAMRLNPHYPDWYDRGLGTAAYLARRYDEAVAAFKKVSQHVIQSRLYLAASYAQLGRLKEARAEVAAALELDADISIEKFSRIELYKNPADLEHLRDGLRKAGLGEKTAREITDKPSIAVLPFENLDHSDATGRLADGIARDIITDLARYRDLDVIARNSTAIYKDKTVDAQTVGKDLGVRYVLEGAIQWQAERIRVTAQLIDAETGTHLWLDRWDRPADDIFAIQTEVAERVTSALGGKNVLFSESRAAAKRKRPSDLEAYDLWVLAADALLQTSEADLRQGVAYADEAITKDPGLVRAYTEKGWLLLNLSKYTKVYRETHLEMERLARKAIEIDPYDAEAHVLLAFAAGMLGNIAESRTANDRALELNPSSADILNIAAENMPYLGMPEKGAEMCDRAFRLNPHHPNWYYLDCAGSYFFTGRYQDVVDIMNSYDAVGDLWSGGLIWRAASQAELGGSEAAASTVSELQQRYPELSIESQFNTGWIFERDQEEQKILASAHKAGIRICATQAEISEFDSPRELEECIGRRQPD